MRAIFINNTIMNKCKIIAEAGINHNGKISLAYRLIDEAKKNGADYVKFQIYKTENLTTGVAKLAKYQSNSTKEKKINLNYLKKMNFLINIIKN